MTCGPRGGAGSSDRLGPCKDRSAGELSRDDGIASRIGAHPRAGRGRPGPHSPRDDVDALGRARHGGRGPGRRRHGSRRDGRAPAPRRRADGPAHAPQGRRGRHARDHAVAAPDARAGADDAGRRGSRLRRRSRRCPCVPAQGRERGRGPRDRARGPPGRVPPHAADRAQGDGPVSPPRPAARSPARRPGRQPPARPPPRLPGRPGARSPIRPIARSARRRRGSSA